MWCSPSRRSLLKFGLTLAGAFLSKFSSGLLFFVFIAFALSLRWRGVPDQPTDKAARRTWRRRAWRNLAKATLWAALFVYISYFVLSWNESTDSFSIIPHFPTSPFLRRLLMPLWLYFRGLMFFAFSAGSRPTYILGHAYSHGVWFYFPALFILKSPLAFLLLLLLTAGIAILWKRPCWRTTIGDTERHGTSVARRMGVTRGLCGRCHAQSAGHQHSSFLSLALALLILLLAPLPRMLRSLYRSNRRVARTANWVTIGLAVASLATAVWAYPNYFPFLNLLSMGRPGYLLVNDSNLDWNHALPEVESFVRQRGLNHDTLG